MAFIVSHGIVPNSPPPSPSRMRVNRLTLVLSDAPAHRATLSTAARDISVRSTAREVTVRWAKLSTADVIATARVDLGATFTPSSRSTTVAFKLVSTGRCGDDDALDYAVDAAALLARSFSRAVVLVSATELPHLARALVASSTSRDACNELFPRRSFPPLHPIALLSDASAIATVLLAFIGAEARESYDVASSSQLAQQTQLQERSAARLEIVQSVGYASKVEALQLLHVFKTLRGISRASASEVSAESSARHRLCASPTSCSLLTPLTLVRCADGGAHVAGPQHRAGPCQGVARACGRINRASSSQSSSLIRAIHVSARFKRRRPSFDKFRRLPLRHTHQSATYRAIRSSAYINAAALKWQPS